MSFKQQITIELKYKNSNIMFLNFRAGCKIGSGHLALSRGNRTFKTPLDAKKLDSMKSIRHALNI